MKGFVFWVLFSVLGTALVLRCLSTKGSTSSVTGMTLTHFGEAMSVVARNRKLKENGFASSTTSDMGSVNLEDYRPIDPVPSSKASIRPGPIQHGTPLMPYIPKPSPPGHPKHGGFP
ncbi:Unconventional myosin-VIIb like [Actinidia chinensis var. chinensis]|uniref:Unconventional myosin-VIIb like n=1 Tax=Actinidia chinensis var. chinensis TaxID=1590841 RepID=A0A2R6RN79_ACTCC|nr:Unconventional myosin-VIIb like [Actinidia chinensis var. chinensis]